MQYWSETSLCTRVVQLRSSIPLRVAANCFNPDSLCRPSTESTRLDSGGRLVIPYNLLPDLLTLHLTSQFGAK
jgi:hypothetical protein